MEALEAGPMEPHQTPVILPGGGGGPEPGTAWAAVTAESASTARGCSAGGKRSARGPPSRRPRRHLRSLWGPGDRDTATGG